MTFAEIAYVVTGAAAFGSCIYMLGRDLYFSGPQPTAEEIAAINAMPWWKRWAYKTYGVCKRVVLGIVKQASEISDEDLSHWRESVEDMKEGENSSNAVFVAVGNAYVNDIRVR